MTTESTEKLLVEGLQELYYAEQKLVDALETLAEQTEDETASQAFEEHREETQGHIDRLDEVFEMLDMEPETEKCDGIEGLITEHESFVEDEDPDQHVLDAHNLVAGQKTEHYEIAAYGNLALMADRLGMDDAGDLLHENLEEEQDALDELSSLTEDYDFEAISSQSAD